LLPEQAFSQLSTRWSVALVQLMFQLLLRSFYGFASLQLAICSWLNALLILVRLLPQGPAQRFRW
jgi:hypothetical protein